MFHRFFLAIFLSCPLTATAFTVPAVAFRRNVFRPVSTAPYMSDAEAITEEATPELTAEEMAAAPELTAEEKEARTKRSIQRVRHTMYVGNLPFDITEAEIKEVFEPHGKISLVSLPRDKESQKPRGFAFVDIGSEEELQAAINAVDGTLVGGREVRVNKSVPKGEAPVARKAAPVQMDGYKKIYVGNIPFTSTTDELVDFYSEYGEVKEAFIPSNRETGLGRGFAFVTMKEEDCSKAIEATNGLEYEGRSLVVNEPLPPGEKAPIRRNKGTKLYVGNLSFYTVIETLEDLFGEFGEIIDCYLPEDPESGGTRGFGFVTMNKDDALRAIEEIDGCEVDGRVIRVNEAQPKGQKRASPSPPEDSMGDEELGVISSSWEDLS